MRKLLTVVVALAILAGAYSFTFGVPAPLLAMVSGTTDSPAEADDTAAAARPGGGRGPGGAGGRGGRRGGSNTTTVVTQALEVRPYESVISAVGTASALRSADVVSDVAGTVVETNLIANREVTAGDVLLRLDARAEVLNLEVATAQLEQANATVARYERLQATGNSTVTDVTLSEAQLAQRLAEADVGLAELAVEDRIIRAPISGRLALSDVEVGDTISANSVLVSIDQSSSLVIEFELPERAVGLLAEAEEVLASTSSFTGRVFTASIISFDSRIDDVTRSVTVEALIDNTEGLLWPGMTFAVRLTQESEPLPVVPSTAITWSREGSSVWIDAGGVAEQVPVTILYRQNDSAWISSDIAEGAMVVTEGAHKLRDGAALSTGAGEGANAGADAGGRPRDRENGQRGQTAGAEGAPEAERAAPSADATNPEDAT
ncbi:efflux RND transporter periplasmic adaptor subunit [Rhodobacteraceae bacterium M385]|nr:efflux RND transporter periplasmic adaptor subunit [Rhodobacteraceae bacterium M385]